MAYLSLVEYEGVMNDNIGKVPSKSLVMMPTA